MWHGFKFKAGDLITGIDRSYTRAIYRVKGYETPELFECELVSFDGFIAENYKHLYNRWVFSSNEYRIATEADIAESYIRRPRVKLSKCECGTKAPVGQNHSNWCKAFKTEF